MSQDNWSRRAFLRGAAATVGGVASLGANGMGTAHASGGPLKGPRYFVVVFLRGGMDAVFTVDPKIRSQVRSTVDVPYSPNDIIDAGPLQFGPHFKGLKPWASEMSIVHGVQVKTANHETGAEQMLRLRTGVTAKMPGILDIIGQHREQALGTVNLGFTSSAESTAAALGGPTADSKKTVFDKADKLTPEEARTLSGVYSAHLQRIPHWQSSDDAVQTRAHLQQSADFFARLAEVPAFKSEKWSDRPGRQTIARDFQRTLWLLENDITRTVYLKIFLDWDSHYFNETKQVGANRTFTFLFNQFLTDLQSRSNHLGPLSEQTAIVLGSELGRFPIVNGNDGKDHFPEAPYIFMGAGFRKGVSFGATGPMMQGYKVSLKTGQPDDMGRHLVLDDVGTTLLHMAGINPRIYGYQGERLGFLETSG